MKLSFLKSYNAFDKGLFRLSCCILISLSLSQPVAVLLYTSINEAEGNRVIVFDITEDAGNLIEIGSFPTGGTDTGAPLGNQSALTTNASDR